MSNDEPSHISDLPASRASESYDPASACGTVSGDAAPAIMSAADFVPRLPRVTEDSTFEVPVFDPRPVGVEYWIKVFYLAKKKCDWLGKVAEVTKPIASRPCAVENCTHAAAVSMFEVTRYPDLDSLGTGACFDHFVELLLWPKSPFASYCFWRFYKGNCVSCKTLESCIQVSGKRCCIHCVLDNEFGQCIPVEPEYQMVPMKAVSTTVNARFPEFLDRRFSEMRLGCAIMMLDEVRRDPECRFGYFVSSANVGLKRIQLRDSKCDDCGEAIDFSAKEPSDFLHEKKYGFLCFPRRGEHNIDRTQALLLCHSHTLEYAFCGNLDKQPKCMACDAPNVRFYKPEMCLPCCVKRHLVPPCTNCQRASMNDSGGLCPQCYRA